MTTLTGLDGTITLGSNAITITRKTGTETIPLAAISGIAFHPAKGIRPGHVRVELVASWAGAPHPTADPYAVEFGGGFENTEWESFAATARAAAALALPKKSLPILSHHAGSGWPDAALEKPAPKPKPERASLLARLSQWAANQPDYLEGLMLHGETLAYRSQVQTVHGASAYVSATGAVDRHATATRVIVGGALFGKTGAVVGALAKKKVDNRQLYIHIAGLDYTWAIPIDPDKERAAHSLAAKINTAARQ